MVDKTKRFDWDVIWCRIEDININFSLKSLRGYPKTIITKLRTQPGRAGTRRQHSSIFYLFKDADLRRLTLI